MTTSIPTSPQIPAGIIEVGIAVAIGPRPDNHPIPTGPISPSEHPHETKVAGTPEMVTIINDSGIDIYIARVSSLTPRIIAAGQATTILSVGGEQETYFVWNYENGELSNYCIHRETFETIVGGANRHCWTLAGFRSG
jgi:hypothetical protein